MFTDEPFVITPNTGHVFLEWLNSGKNFYMSNEQLVELNELLNQLDNDMQAKVRNKYPNFANEEAARFVEIRDGLTGMIAKSKVEAKEEVDHEQPTTDDLHDLEYYNATKSDDIDNFNPLGISA